MVSIVVSGTSIYNTRTGYSCVAAASVVFGGATVPSVTPNFSEPPSEESEFWAFERVHWVTQSWANSI
jgi:hypothetical protein